MATPNFVVTNIHLDAVRDILGQKNGRCLKADLKTELINRFQGPSPIDDDDATNVIVEAIGDDVVDLDSATGDIVLPAPPQPTPLPTPTPQPATPPSSFPQWAYWAVGAVVAAILLASWLYISWPESVDGKLADFRKEIVNTVDAKIASASEAITAKAHAAIAAASDILQTVGARQQKMADDIIRISLQQKETAENVLNLATRVVSVEGDLVKYKNALSEYNKAISQIAEQSTRAIALARTALVTEEVQVYISTSNFLYNRSDLPSAMNDELEQAGFRNGTKQVVAVFGTADQGRSDERNRTLVRERSKNGADWLGSDKNARGGEYPAVVDPFNGSNCRKLVIVYRLTATASATK